MRGTVVLAGDRTVQRLNAMHRGKNKPTNVLTYEHPAPEAILALGVVRAEAAALVTLRPRRQPMERLLTPPCG